LVVKFQGKRHIEDAGINGRIILKLIVKKYVSNMWTRILGIEENGRFFRTQY
jgi:hypothetical protein